jgi:hypothetical protein
LLVLRLSLIAVCLFTGLQSPAPALQDAAAAGLRAPFQIGEELIYTIKWDPPWYMFFLPAMEAGEAHLHLKGETEYKNGKALKVVLQAHSSGSLAKLAGLKIEDTYDFVVEPESYCTFASSAKIREGKRKRQIDIEYLRETRQLHFREVDEAVDPPQIKKDVIKNDIPLCVRDPFSALYFYRMAPLQLNHEQTLVIGDNDKIKEIRCRVEKQESVEVPAGKFSAWRVNTTALMGGLFKEGGQFKIWFSADDRKIPVKFEVRVRLGRVVGKLKLRGKNS